MLRRTPLPRWCGLAALVWFVVLAARTPVDVDEGFYALAIELAANGKMPYRDFFYPQGPVFPYLLTPFVLLFGSGFMMLRMVSAGIAATATTLVAHAVHRETKSTMATITAAILFSIHELSWQWLITIRPYHLGVVCLIASLLIATPVEDRDAAPSSASASTSSRSLLLAGAIGALAPLMRLPLAPALFIAPLVLVLRKSKPSITRAAIIFGLIAIGSNVPNHPFLGVLIALPIAFVLALYGRRDETLQPLRALRVAGIYLAGAAAVILPIAGFFYLAHRESFLYGTVGYHVDSSLFVSFPRNRVYLSAIIGGGALGELTAMGTQNVLLIVVGLIGLVLPNRETRMATLIGVGALVFGAARHEPMSEHYLTPIIPYLAISAGMTIGYIERRLPVAIDDRASPRFILFAVCMSVTLLFALAGASSLERKWVYAHYGGWKLEQYRPRALDKKLAAVKRVTSTYPGPFMSTWPGTALGNARIVISGYENHFTRVVASKKSSEEAQRLHLTSLADFQQVIIDQRAAVIALDRESGLGNDRAVLEAMLERAAYTKIETEGDVAVYAAPPSTSVK